MVRIVLESIFNNGKLLLVQGLGGGREGLREGGREGAR
jgi:hypothetical protein